MRTLNRKGTMFYFAMNAPRIGSKNHILKKKAFVIAGATDALAPTEIWQRVMGTHPEKGKNLLNSTKCSKTRSLNQNKPSLKVEQHQICANIVKRRFFEERDSTTEPQSPF